MCQNEGRNSRTLDSGKIGSRVSSEIKPRFARNINWMCASFLHDLEPRRSFRGQQSFDAFTLVASARTFRFQSLIIELNFGEQGLEFSDRREDCAATHRP
jgi:hypothetical protein